MIQDFYHALYPKRIANVLKMLFLPVFQGKDVKRSWNCLDEATPLLNLVHVV